MVVESQYYALSSHQYGFPPGYSCTSQLIHLFHEWAKAPDIYIYNPFLIITYYVCYYLNKVVINKIYDCHSLRQMITFIEPMQSIKF